MARPLTRPAVLGFALALVAWGNAKSLLLEGTATLPGGSVPLALAGAALVAGCLLFARWASLGASAIGTGRIAVRATVLSGVAAAALAGLGVAALRLVAPRVTGVPFEYAPLLHVDAPALVWHVLVLLPLSVAIPEEVAFRGALVGALLRSGDQRRAIVGSATAFALWHAAIVRGTISDTTLAPGPLFAVIGVIGAAAVVFAGGLVFAWLRLRTGSLGPTIAAHWAFNAVVLVGLWVAR